LCPSPPDHLRVEARQVSPEMKDRLIERLGNTAGVRLEFPAPDGPAPGSGAKRIVPSAGGSPAPSDPRLASFLGSTEAQENYARSVLGTSDAVLARLYALRDLADRWPEDRERELSASARASLQDIVRDHAKEVADATSDLQKQLAPLMLHFGALPAEPIPARPGGSWREASKSGLDAALRLNRTLRSLLTTSDAPLSAEQALSRLRESLANLQQVARQL
jgi:hypothetical protein